MRERGWRAFSSSSRPLKRSFLILLHRLVVLHERGGELMRPVVLRHEVEGPGSRWIQRRADRANAGIRNRTRWQTCKTVCIVGTTNRQVFLMNVPVEIG